MMSTAGSSCQRETEKRNALMEEWITGLGAGKRIDSLQMTTERKRITDARKARLRETERSTRDRRLETEERTCHDSLQLRL